MIKTPLMKDESTGFPAKNSFEGNADKNTISLAQHPTVPRKKDE
jgi:hypothetical protein